MRWVMKLKCPECSHESAIEQGEAIECKKCNARPEILWNGRAGIGIHVLGETVKVKSN